MPALVELKLAAGRARDEGDIIELLRANPQEVVKIRSHVNGVHPDYAAALLKLIERAQEQDDK